MRGLNTKPTVRQQQDDGEERDPEQQRRCESEQQDEDKTDSPGYQQTSAHSGDEHLNVWSR